MSTWGEQLALIPQISVIPHLLLVLIAMLLVALAIKAWRS